MKNIADGHWNMIQRFREEVSEMSSTLDELHDRASTYHSERSEEWLDSDPGIAYEDWVTNLEQAKDAAEELVEQLDNLTQKPTG